MTITLSQKLNNFAIINTKLQKRLSYFSTQEEKLGILLESTKKESEQLKEFDTLQEFLQKCSNVVYSNLSNRLGEIITEGLRHVFPEYNYTFNILFVERRNKIEVDFVLTDPDGEQYHPTDDVGGGVADMISMLLRITYITLSKHINILFADEPLKFIDKDRVPVAAQFIKKVCEDLNFQIVMATHIPEFMQVAEACYRVQQINKISKVEEL